MQTDNEKNKLLYDLRRDIARGQKKGLHFILAAAVVWAFILIIHILPLALTAKNVLTVLCSAPMFLLAMLFAKLIHVDFFDKSNPLYKPGILFAMNQMLYIPISIWTFYACPEKMLMIYAVITGAHLLPFAWLYCSGAYFYFSLIWSAAALAAGWMFSSSILAACMLPLVILFCFCLHIEVRKEYGPEGDTDISA